MQLLRELIDRAVDHAVEYQGDQELLDLGRRDIDLARDEADRDARVRLDDLEQHLPYRAMGRNQWQSMAINGTQWHSMALNGTHLRPNVLEQVINIGLDERVTHH